MYWRWGCHGEPYGGQRTTLCSLFSFLFYVGFRIQVSWLTDPLTDHFFVSGMCACLHLFQLLLWWWCWCWCWWLVVFLFLFCFFLEPASHFSLGWPGTLCRPNCRDPPAKFLGLKAYTTLTPGLCLLETWSCSVVHTGLKFVILFIH